MAVEVGKAVLGLAEGAIVEGMRVGAGVGLRVGATVGSAEGSALGSAEGVLASWQ